MIKLCEKGSKLNFAKIANTNDKILMLKSAPSRTGMARSNVTMPTLANPIKSARVATELWKSNVVVNPKMNPSAGF